MAGAFPFFKTRSANIFPATPLTSRKALTTCSAIAPSMFWETGAAEILATWTTGTRIAAAAAFPISGIITVKSPDGFPRLLRQCGLGKDEKLFQQRWIGTHEIKAPR